jgi:hypothetical protein
MHTQMVLDQEYFLPYVLNQRTHDLDQALGVEYVVDYHPARFVWLLTAASIDNCLRV